MSLSPHAAVFSAELSCHPKLRRNGLLRRCECTGRLNPSEKAMQWVSGSASLRPGVKDARTTPACPHRARRGWAGAGCAYGRSWKLTAFSSRQRGRYQLSPPRRITARGVPLAPGTFRVFEERRASQNALYLIGVPRVSGDDPSAPLQKARVIGRRVLSSTDVVEHLKLGILLEDG
jgi:hypothetical protein